jgi:putative N6-adenine-specific DNA methylase
VIHEFHAKTLRGLEEVLAGELASIGASDIKPVNRGVNFSGSVSMLYKANLYLRTALRILMPISTFRAVDEDMVYKKVLEIDWSEYMTYKNSFAVDAVVFSRIFRNSHFIELRIKDAIVDQFRKKTSLRPSVDLKNAEIRINIHVQEKDFIISLDSSGASLHKRGYQKEMHPASMSEVLAAGLVKLTGWNGDRPFLNPMCGSGTIALEAAMIAANIYPGMIGRDYAFKFWPGYDALLFRRLLEGMPKQQELTFPVVASDIDREAIRITKRNARLMGLADQLVIEKADFFDSLKDDTPQVIVINPPYGERLDVGNIEEFYNGIGSTLKHRYPASDAWIFTANMDVVKHIGLKPDMKFTLFNAALECRYIKYTLFSGARKQHLEVSV